MQTTIIVLAWIGLVAVAILSLATLYVWLDWLVCDAFKRISGPTANWYALRLLVGIRLAAKSRLAGNVGYMLHLQIEQLRKVDPESVAEFDRIRSKAAESGGE